MTLPGPSMSSGCSLRGVHAGIGERRALCLTRGYLSDGRSVDSDCDRGGHGRPATMREVCDPGCHSCLRYSAPPVRAKSLREGGTL